MTREERKKLIDILVSTGEMINEERVADALISYGLINFEKDNKQMEIKRKRYCIMRNNRSEVYCRSGLHYHFKAIKNVRDDILRMNLTEEDAKASYHGSDKDVEIVPVIEKIIFEEE